MDSQRTQDSCISFHRVAKCLPHLGAGRPLAGVTELRPVHLVSARRHVFAPPGCRVLVSGVSELRPVHLVPARRHVFAPTGCRGLVFGRSPKTRPRIFSFFSPLPPWKGPTGEGARG